MVNEETIRFLRAGEYRCKTFAEAEANVYSNKPFMEKYMDGLLVSQPLWFNHARTYFAFKHSFLPSLVPDADYLEIGPGHGLLLAQAASDPAIASVSAWDVSAESLRQTARALTRLGINREAHLEQRDVLAAPPGETFDAIVISEVLEHLEEPRRALEALVRHLREGGRIFINVPVNSPAPDHIYLLRTPDEAVELVESAGLRIKEQAFEPMSGYSLERAKTRGATITCLFVAERAQ
jgi:SAM-dependent methyltransferase